MKGAVRQSLGHAFFIRMFSLILALTVLAFALITFVLRVYIRADVSARLSSMVSGLVTSSEGGETNLSDEELHGKGTQGNAFRVSAQGEVSDILQGDPWTVRGIASVMQEKGFIRADVRSEYVETEQGKYYISCVADKLHPEAYMAFYVDVTTVVRFYWAVSVTLLAVLGVAGVVAVIVAHSSSRQLQGEVTRLSDYAVRIGKRDFKAARPEYREQELDDLARAMERMAGDLQETQDQQTVFFQNISHELRTPLMSIRCYAEGIACGVMDAKESGETILEETDQLTGMVEDLLYISRMDQGMTKRHMETVDLRDILSECISAQRRQAQRRQVEFDFRFTDEAVWFTCDPQEINQMYTNLLTNALRYARSVITLECRAEHSEILLVVSDDGVGLSETDIPHIFERFYKGRGGQHGVGLSIVQSIVELYGGSIAVKNQDGARFEVRLPRH